MNQKFYFSWTEDKKYTLAKLALRYEGYKSSDKPHNEKWETILEISAAAVDGRDKSCWRDHHSCRSEVQSLSWKR